MLLSEPDTVRRSDQCFHFRDLLEVLHIPLMTNTLATSSSNAG